MEKSALMKRIIIDPNVMVGKPIIKGTRIPVIVVMEALTEGMTMEQIIEEYQLTKEDILACLAFAAYFFA